MKTEELLNRASRSFFYGIRLAHRKAEKEILKMKKRV